MLGAPLVEDLRLRHPEPHAAERLPGKNTPLAGGVDPAGSASAAAASATASTVKSRMRYRARSAGAQAASGEASPSLPFRSR